MDVDEIRLSFGRGRRERRAGRKGRVEDERAAMRFMERIRVEQLGEEQGRDEGECCEAKGGTPRD